MTSQPTPRDVLAGCSLPGVPPGWCFDLADACLAALDRAGYTIISRADTRKGRLLPDGLDGDWVVYNEERVGGTLGERVIVAPWRDG